MARYDGANAHLLDSALPGAMRESCLSVGQLWNMRTDRTTHLQRCIDRLRAGDHAARAELIAGACGRLRTLARHMLRGDRVRQWEQTDDVLQQSLIKLHHTMANIQPPTVRDFMRLAAWHIRRTLAELARHYFRTPGRAALYALDGASDTHARQAFIETPSYDAHPEQRLQEAELWQRLHEEVERLDDDEREIVELIWFHDLTQEEAAEIVGVSVRTVQRRWMQSRLKLHAALANELPWT